MLAMPGTKQARWDHSGFTPPPSVMQDNPLFIWVISLEEALFVVSPAVITKMSPTWMFVAYVRSAGYNQG